VRLVDVRAWAIEAHEEWVSSVDGTFHFPVAVTKLLVHHPHADLVSVENGTLGGNAELEPGRIVQPAESGTLRLVFRDRPGMAFVLLRDGVSGAAITDLSGVRIEWRVPDGRRWRYDFEAEVTYGGWIPLSEEGFLRSLENPPDPATVRVEFSAPGYDRRAVPQSDLKGRVELSLDPVPPDVKGTVALARGLEDAAVNASIRSLDEGVTASATLEVRGLPVAPGPFALHDLPQGRWALEVRAEKAGYVARTTKEFDHFAETADVGTITLRVGAGIRARILDARGQVIPQADVVVVREEEDPLQARRLETDRDGYVSYGDLEPGVRHRVAVLGLPVSMEKVVTSPTKPGSTEAVEFRWEGAVVACSFRFSLDGAPLKRPTALKEAPVRAERQVWQDEGVFTTSLLPGPHRFSIEVLYEDGSIAGLYTAEVEVPAGDTYETTIELKKSENER
jgi:hypothetical protein